MHRDAPTPSLAVVMQSSRGRCHSAGSLSTPGAVTLARGRAPTPVLGTAHYAQAAVTCCAGTELGVAAVTREAASEDVGADEAADATCAGDDGGAEIASPADEGTETASLIVGAILFTRRVER